MIDPTGASAADPAPKRFTVVTGLLCEAKGLRLTRTDRQTLLVKHGGKAWELRVYPKKSDKPTDYECVSRRAVEACPPLFALLAGRMPPSTSKVFEVHRVVAVVGRGGDFTLNGTRLAAHHVDLNGGNNTANNLRVVSTATHDRLHRHIGANVNGYLALLAEQPDGTANMAEDLLANLAADRAAYEGHALPDLDEGLAPV